MKKLFKNSYISALLIGILGTALWEKFISPTCAYIYINISSLFEIYITTFSNETYKEISNGFNDTLSLYIIMIILILLVCIAIMTNLIPIMLKYSDKITTKIVAKIETRSDPSKSLHKQLIFLRIGRILSLFLLIISSAYLIGNLAFITDCKTKSLCNIEIISPYVSDLEYKQLKSTFYSIQTKDDYTNFTEAINKIGEKYSLDLKK